MQNWNAEAVWHTAAFGKDFLCSLLWVYTSSRLTLQVSSFFMFDWCVFEMLCFFCFAVSKWIENTMTVYFWEFQTLPCSAHGWWNRQFELISEPVGVSKHCLPACGSFTALFTAPVYFTESCKAAGVGSIMLCIPRHDAKMTSEGFSLKDVSEQA